MISMTNQSGQLMKYEDGKWREIEQIDRLKVTKLEGQVRDYKQHNHIYVFYLSIYLFIHLFIIGVVDFISSIVR